jgi:hypothetical protein
VATLLFSFLGSTFWHLGHALQATGIFSPQWTQDLTGIGLLLLEFVLQQLQNEPYPAVRTVPELAYEVGSLLDYT